MSTSAAGESKPLYRLWVSEDRTTLVRLWPNGIVEVARRPSTDHLWGPPVLCEEEKTQ